MFTVYFTGLYTYFVTFKKCHSTKKEHSKNIVLLSRDEEDVIRHFAEKLSDNKTPT